MRALDDGKSRKEFRFKDRRADHATSASRMMASDKEDCVVFNFLRDEGHSFCYRRNNLPQLEQIAGFRATKESADEIDFEFQAELGVADVLGGEAGRML